MSLVLFLIPKTIECNMYPVLFGVKGGLGPVCGFLVLEVDLYLSLEG
jgi:hypothetical protein